MPRPRYVHYSACDNAWAGHGDSGGGGCASERPTRAFPAALTREPVSQSDNPAAGRPFTSASYRRSPEDFRPPSGGRGRPERRAAAILSPRRPRPSPGPAQKCGEAARRLQGLGRSLPEKALQMGGRGGMSPFSFSDLDSAFLPSVKSTVAPRRANCLHVARHLRLYLKP
jgi:hypothetical protein